MNDRVLLGCEIQWYDTIETVVETAEVGEPLKTNTVRDLLESAKYLTLRSWFGV